MFYFMLLSNTFSLREVNKFFFRRWTKKSRRKELDEKKKKKFLVLSVVLESRIVSRGHEVLIHRVFILR